MGKIVINDNSYLKEISHVVKYEENDKYKKLQDEAQIHIKESRRREQDAWISAQDYIAKEGPVRKLNLNTSKNK